MSDAKVCMPYTDFSLDALRVSFGLTIRQAALFPGVVPIAVPPWLHETLAKGMPMALGSKKARSECVIAPILLTLRDLNQNRIAIYSGQRLDGDPNVGLVGECDFLITSTQPLPIIQAPIISLVEAKKNDIEAGLGQCAAQMVGAQRFNQRGHTNTITTMYGCVTTGEVWQMLKLTDNLLILDTERYYINTIETILGVLQSIIQHYLPLSQSSPPNSLDLLDLLPEAS